MSREEDGKLIEHDRGLMKRRGLDQGRHPLAELAPSIRTRSGISLAEFART